VPQDMTHRFMADAGIREGMRVLDIGCGHGDVALLAARLVGTRGEVLGIDQNEAAISAARTRARELGHANVRFAHADLGAPMSELGRFDAVAGRRVLMYQPDAVECLTRLAEVLVPGGLIVLQEHDSTAMPVCRPAMPLHERVSAWIWQTVAREGADVHIGLNLAHALVRAGFTVERVRAEATVLTAHQSHAIGAIVRAMLERIVAAGVATAREIDADTLDERLAAERQASKGTCLWEMIFGAWARKAG
jgi:cyclopropane fatty-acyl-phospholipid synthase-like methyltransferase